MKALKSIVLISLMLFSALLQADETPAPVALIKDTSEKVLNTLEQNKALYKKAPEKIYELVNKIILPHLDFRAMSKLALGKNWRNANEVQQQRFVAAFKTMLVRTYSKSLTEYTGQKLEFLPYRPPREGSITATVNSRILQDNGPAIPIDYRLRIKDGVWKVYDIAIDGISLVTNYRNSFASDIRRMGMDGLITELEAKNESS